MIAIRVLLVDDHAIVRAGLSALLDTIEDLDVVGTATDGRTALAEVDRLKPDVVLMDLRMPELDGVTAISALQDRPNPPAVVVITVHETDSDILAAIEAGATGYLVKDAPGDQIVAAVRAAHRGEPVLSPAVTRRLLHRSRQPTDRTLTTREIEVLTHVAAGSNNRDIADTLFISEATVKSHLNHIYTKLSVDSRTAAVAKATNQGII